MATRVSIVEVLPAGSGVEADQEGTRVSVDRVIGGSGERIWNSGLDLSGGQER